MLIRTIPLQLHTAMDLTCGAEGFSERLRGNYSLLGTHFASKDLLLLMTGPPEAAEPQAGMTVLVDQSVRQDTWNVTMGVVNNMVNRILLDGSERFTYQDQAYITTVLNRLGITDAEGFMTQVRQLRAEVEGTAHLLSLYRSELARIQKQRLEGGVLPPLPVPAAGEDSPAVPDSGVVEMALAVLRRLDAVQSFERLYAFQRSWSSPVNQFRRNELCLSEQLRFGGDVSLEETKRQVFQNSQLSLVCHRNRYELEAAPEEGGEYLLSQAAAAVLTGAADNALVQVLNRPGLRQDQWLRLENALWQSAENSLARFALYQEAPAPAAAFASAWTEETVWNRCAGELREYQTLRQYLRPQGTEAPLLPPVAGKLPFAFLPVSPEGEKTEGLPAWRRAGQDKAEEPRQAALQKARFLETARERLERVLETARRLSPPDQLSGQGPVIRHVERTEETGVFREATLETDGLRTELRRLEWVLREQKLWPPAPSVRERSLRLERETLSRESRRTETLRREERFGPVPVREWEWRNPPQLERRTAPASPPPLVLTAREAEEQAPELLEEAIRQIDRHNRTILHNIPPETEAQSPVSLPALDLRRTLRDSLRALSEPETLLREVMEERRAAESAAPLTLTHREEMLLRQLPPGERKVYEAVLAYRKDPEGALAQGLLRPGSLGELHGALRQAARPAVELEHSAPEVEEAKAERITEQPKTALERVLQMPVRQERRTKAHTPPPAVEIFHKTSLGEAAEEERTERRRTHSTVQTDSRYGEVRRHQERQADVTRQERTIAAETTEDITALVNRTLAGQMRAISDQVYRQMEKRLQMERSRRGRM